MLKKILNLLLIMLATVLIAGCSAAGDVNTQQTEVPKLTKVIIQAPPSPPTAPLLKMVADKPLGEDVEIELTFYKTVEEATARVIKGEADFTILPVNVAAKLYNKDADISLANVSTWGLLYLVSTTDISNWDQLKGQELAVGAQGASPDIITRYLLDKNGVDTSDINIKYANSPEIAQMIIEGLLNNAVLPEPQVTQVLLKNPAVKIVKNFNEEWEMAEGNNVKLPQAGMIVQNKFAKEYPEALNTIQDAYGSAIELTINDPKTVSQLVQDNFNIPALIFEQSMTRTKLQFATANDAKADVENYLSKLLEFSPDMVGGQLPDEEFYLAK
jgi:NitT/TauT family transport system substrate-binding protein